MANEKRLIDALPLMRNGWHLVKTGKSNVYLGSMSLADVPPVDAVEVVHGRWELYPSSMYRRCSVCKMEYERPKFNVRANYCPNCGAKMDGERRMR